MRSHCILSCTNEHWSSPKQGHSCRLAMDGVKILASGFDNDEKARISQLVNDMGGVLYSKASPDVNFVIVKNVLAAKYKWASHVLKKPVVSISWLNQCWLEHRLVPQEPYRVPPFSGLRICVTRIPLDERKEIEKLIVDNGGQYSGDLTKKCTHLVSDAPEGDKYFVAKRWGHIHIVLRRWVHLSVARKTCLEEEKYSTHGSSVTRTNRRQPREEQSQDWSSSYTQCVQSDLCGEQETWNSQKIDSSVSDANAAINDSSKAHDLPAPTEAKSDACVAQDSEDEDNDLYLANCRILLLGFDLKESRKLVNIIRKGGGSRFKSLKENLTHIVIGMPSEIEKKEVRHLAAWGVIDVVRSAWLEECGIAKKELPVSQRHIASDYFMGKESAFINNGLAISNADAKEGNASAFNSMGTGQKIAQKIKDGFAFEKLRCRGSAEVNLHDSSDSKVERQLDSQLLEARDENKRGSMLASDPENMAANEKTLAIFKGRSFYFSSSFPEERRADIIEWIRDGGGLLVGDCEKARFIIECHGVTQKLAYAAKSTVVSAHWIRSCLLEGSIQDVSSHVLYSPLQCHVPLPGFENLRFCISQYETRERRLLRNLCFTLGSDCKDKLTRKSTHLLCKFTSGPKYEKACEWGIHSVTAEWIFQCVKQDNLVSMDLYRPKEAITKDKEAGSCLPSQHPTQAGLLYSDYSDRPSQTPRIPDRSESKHRTRVQVDASEGPEPSMSYYKRSKNSEEDCAKIASPSFETTDDLLRSETVVPDVAAAIEDLLAQSNEIQDLKLPVENGYNKSNFPQDGYQSHANSTQASRISSNWSNRSLEKSSICNPAGIDGMPKSFDAFSETQTDSQVVGYEEDLSGRQKIIDRVRSQSLTMTSDKH